MDLSSLLNITALALVIVGVGDLALLPSCRKSGVELGLRLIVGACLILAGFLLYQKDLDLPFLAVLGGLGLAGQLALVYRSAVEYRRARARPDENDPGRDTPA
jgi:hypothetical protein